MKKQINKFNKEYKIGSGKSLTKNEIKDIIKVIKSLENRWMLLKGTTKKIVEKKGDFSVFWDY